MLTQLNTGYFLSVNYWPTMQISFQNVNVNVGFLNTNMSKSGTNITKQWFKTIEGNLRKYQHNWKQAMISLQEMAEF